MHKNICKNYYRNKKKLTNTNTATISIWYDITDKLCRVFKAVGIGNKFELNYIYIYTHTHTQVFKPKMNWGTGNGGISCMVNMFLHEWIRHALRKEGR